MASLSSAVFLLLALLSLQTHARESQYFSKFNVDDSPQEALLPDDTRDGRNTRFYPENTPIKTSLPYNREQSKHEQDPTFVRESGNGYGLYGHESRQLPPSTTTKEKDTVPTYATTSLSQSHEPSKYNYDAFPAGNDNYDGYDRNAFDQRQGLGETRFAETRYADMGHENGDGSHFYNKNGYKDNRYEGGVGRQGMSDTRFLENGKYFYDVGNERSYYPSRYYQQTTGAPSGKYGYQNDGGRYYGSGNYYGNSNDEFGYQKQQEFMEDQDKQFVP